MSLGGARRGRGSLRRPVRPVAVLDANVLLARGLRDVLLSCAASGVFRPVWQSEIEDEVRRNGPRLGMGLRGETEQQATMSVEHALAQMNKAFPDARLDSRLWVPLVPGMINDRKDRHVLAAAVGARATHVVTDNLRDFPVASRPPGVLVQRPDRFLLERLDDQREAVLIAIRTMAARHQRPTHTPGQLALMMSEGKLVPQFGAALVELLDS